MVSAQATVSTPAPKSALEVVDVPKDSASPSLAGSAEKGTDLSSSLLVLQSGCNAEIRASMALKLAQRLFLLSEMRDYFSNSPVSQIMAPPEV